MNYWLIKSEPHKYSWEQFLKDKKTIWDGVRNYAARNNIRLMKKGDLAFFYHSNDGKEIMGIAKVVKEHYPDPTAEDDTWSVVEVAPFKSLKKTVTLEMIKGDALLKRMEMIRLNRLSVSPVREEEYQRILALSN